MLCSRSRANRTLTWQRRCLSVFSSCFQIRTRLHPTQTDNTDAATGETRLHSCSCKHTKRPKNKSKACNDTVWPTGTAKGPSHKVDAVGSSASKVNSNTRMLCRRSFATKSVKSSSGRGSPDSHTYSSILVVTDAPSFRLCTDLKTRPTAERQNSWHNYGAFEAAHQVKPRKCHHKSRSQAERGTMTARLHWTLGAPLRNGRSRRNFHVSVLACLQSIAAH